MKLLLCVVALLTSATAFSHGDHPKAIAKCAAKCTKEEIQKAVPAAIGSLILKGDVEKGWASGKVESLELKTFSKGPEWVATVSDATNKAHPKLFVFITTDGFSNGSNFTGN